MDSWLAEDVGIGGREQRGFDPTLLISFAWDKQLENDRVDVMYEKYVEHQMNDARSRVSNSMGLSGDLRIDR